MERSANSDFVEGKIKKEAPQLAAVLREMKDGLDAVRSKVEVLTAKVKANNFPTADGISYLEAKHLLLLSHCQSLVYYLLRKAKGLPIQGHPVIQSLVEIRLFLEKIRPIDKKLEYQIQKLTRDAGNATDKADLKEKNTGGPQKSEDQLKYRPNPDMLVPKNDMNPKDGAGVYRPPKIAPAIMDEDKISKQERDALRGEKRTLQEARQGYIKDLIDDMQGRPEEVRESVGIESREHLRIQAQLEERARQEEDIFTRVPLTKKEKRKEKFLKKSRNGLHGLTDSFFDEIKALPLEDRTSEQTMGYGIHNSSTGKLKKRKRHY
uniref:Neuroguidin-B n=2 Tax=Rhizophora mucronata TaxID=61149 RepID=A0A2P2KKA8_RHIMU